MSKYSFPRLATALATLATAALVGCLKTDAKTSLHKDGSGVVTQRIELDLTQVLALGQMLAEMQSATGGGAPAGKDGKMTPPTAEDVAAGLKAMEERLRKTEGLTVKDFKTDKKDGKLVAACTVEFKDWSLLGTSFLFFLGKAELAKNADGSYTYSVDPLAALPAGMDPAVYAPMLEMYAGSMELAHSITVPGVVVETNGTKSEDGSTVSWKLAFKDVFGGKSAQKVTFKGEGLDLKPFTYVPDLFALMDLLNGKAKEKPAEKPAGDKPAGDKPAEKPAEKPADPK